MKHSICRTGPLLAVCLAVTGCGGTPSRSHGAAGGEVSASVPPAPMPTPRNASTTRPIPPIDAAAPSGFQSATFALG